MNRQLFRQALLATVLLLITPAYAQAPNPQAVSMYNLGLTAYKQGSPESAIIFFKRATDIDPNLADAQYNLGVIFQTQRRYKEAIPRFLEVLRIKPTDPDAHFQLGLIYQEAGQLAEARQHLSSIAPNNSHFPESQGRIAQINQQPSGTPGAGAAPNQDAVTSYQLTTPAQPPQLQAQAPQAPVTYPGQTDTIPNQTSSYPPAQLPPVYTAPPAQPTAQPYPPLPVLPAQPVSNPVPVLANTTLRIIATGFNAPAGLAFDRLGNLYVANFLSNTIDRISADGSRTQFSSGISLKGPIGLAVDEVSNLYVANYNGGTVARISPAGVATVIATGLRKPYYLTLDHDGNLYVSQQEDNSIVRITLPHKSP